ncbi:MAG: potassium channel family protein [Planctomycetota bacterium]
MLFSVLVGIPLTIATVAIHAVGTSWWIARLRRSESAYDRPHTIGTTIQVLSRTAVVLLLLTLSEVIVWAAVYRILPGDSGVTSWEQAVYFSAVTFPSLGYGDVVLIAGWRLLSAIQATVGLLIFGWSTAMLFAVIQQCWKAEGKFDESRL